MGSVERTKTNDGDTRYRARYRDPSGKSREKWFRRKTDAERFVRSMEVDKDRGNYIDPEAGRITVAEWIDQHEQSRLKRRPSTVVRDESLIRNHVLPHFGERPLKSISQAEVRAWVSGMAGRELSADTVRKAHRLLARALEAAVDDGLIAANPCRRTELPESARREMRFLTVEEVDTLAETIDPRYKALVITAAYTGLRYGELAALRIGRVDMLRRRLVVAEGVTEVRGELLFSEPKTQASRRQVALPRRVVDTLAAHLAAFGSSTSDLVFTGRTGDPLRASNFRHRHWTPAVGESVGSPLRFHDLRHTHAAWLIHAGQHPKVIQGRLGHSSIRTTLDTYGHLMDGLDEAAADALDDLAANRRVGLAWG